MKKVIFATLVASVVLAGCVSAPSPGAREGAIPPRLVMENNVMRWENAGSFGPLPVSLAAKAAATCSSLNTMDAKFVATGYHSKAQDVNRKTFEGGGFYCVRQ